MAGLCLALVLIGSALLAVWQAMIKEPYRYALKSDEPVNERHPT